MSFRFENLTGGYDDTYVIKSVSGEIQSGEIVGIFGRNGVGKTTLARLLAGQMKAAKGEIFLDGETLRNAKAFLRRKKGLGYLAQTQMVFDQLTVQENLELTGGMEALDAYLERFPKLGERMNQKAGTMSGGERKMLGFVRVMIEPTRYIILDEPSEGMQPENIEHMRYFLLEKAKAGVGVILIEQNINMLLGVSEQYICIDSGEIVYHEGKAKTNRKIIIDLLTV